MCSARGVAQAAVRAAPSTGIGAVHVVAPTRAVGASELLTALEQKVDSSERRRGDWPKGLPQFTGLLRRLAPNLRGFGVRVEFIREGHAGRRMIELQIEASLPG